MVLMKDFLMTTIFIFIIIWIIFLYFLLSFYKLFKTADGGFTWTFGYYDYPNIGIPFWIIQSHSNKKTDLNSIIWISLYEIKL